MLAIARMLALDPRPSASPRPRRSPATLLPRVAWCAIAVLAFLLLVMASGAPLGAGPSPEESRAPGWTGP